MPKVREDRRIPKPEFRPLPSRLRVRTGLRYRQYARFYGNYTSMTGKRKRFSFAVRVDRRRLSPRDMYEYMVVTCNNLLDLNVPQHKQGQVFSSFDELLNEVPWFRIRKLHNYKAGMVYER